MGRLDDRRGDYQAAISGRLALLGNRVGAEFEREIRERLNDLHTWQERSIRNTAKQVAEELSWLYAPLRVRVACVTGGAGYVDQKRALSSNPAVIVATPGRLRDALERQKIDASTLA